MDIFGTLIAQPFGWVFRMILRIFNNYGFAILLFTLFVKILLYPLQYKSKKGMIAQQRLQPQIKDLEARYKSDRNAYNQALQELYQKNGVSPMSGCLPMLVLLFVMLGLYRVIRQPLTYVFGASDKITDIVNSLIAGGGQAATDLAGMADGSTAVNEITVMRYLQNSGEYASYYTDMTFLGLDLSQIPKLGLSLLVLLPIISGITAFIQSVVTQKLQVKTTGVEMQMNASSKSMLYTMPLFSVFLGFTLPAGLTLYWIANNILGIAQEYIMSFQMKKLIAEMKKKEAEEEEVRRIRREEATRKNQEAQMKNRSGEKHTVVKGNKRYTVTRASTKKRPDDDEDDED